MSRFSAARALVLTGLMTLLAGSPAEAGQASDPKRDVVQELGRFSLALDGGFGDEGARLLASLDALQRGLEQWDRQIAGYETTIRAEIARANPAAAARLHLALGGLYLDRGRADEALRELTTAATLDPGRAEVYTLTGLAYSQVANDPAAANAWRKASALAPLDPVRAYSLGRALLKLGAADEAEKALTLFRTDLSELGLFRSDAPVGPSSNPAPFVRLDLVPEASGVDPFFPPVRYAEGFRLLPQRTDLEAIASLRAAAARDPLVVAGPARAGLDRAAAAFRDGSISTAIEHLRTAAAAAPGDAEPYRLLGMVYTADAQHTRAVAELTTAVRLNPDDERARLSLAEAHIANARPAEAEASLRATIARLPASGRAHYALARVLQRQGSYPEALAEFDRALALGPLIGVNGIYATIAGLHVSRQDFEAAITAGERRIESHPNDPEGHQKLGEFYSRLGRDDEALAEFAAAVMLKADYAEAYAATGQVHLRAARYPEAIDAARRAIALDPRYREPRYVLATSLIRLGKADEGARELALFQRLQDEDGTARTHQLAFEGYRREATVASANGDPAKAATMLRKAVALEPSAGPVYLELGRALLEAKQAVAAIDALTRAVALDDTADAHDTLGRAHGAAGHTDDSRREQAIAETMKRDALRRAGAIR